MLTTFSFHLVADDVLTNSTITLADAQYNTSNWAASNLLDNNPSSLWLSSKQVNDINFQLNTSNDAVCIAGFELTNYGNDSSSLNQFMLFTATNSALSSDSGTAGWRPVVAEQNPTDKIDYFSWAQGARLVSVDSQYNNTNWGVKNLNDGSRKSTWLSGKSNNVIEYNFDTDWNDNVGDSIPISEIEISNYGNDDRSVKEFQVEVTNDGVTWQKLEVPGSQSGDPEYIYSRRQDGGILGIIDSQLNSTSWGADNMQDGDSRTLWLSSKGNNTIEFTFDPNNNGTTGANGDTEDYFTFEKFNLENYGADDRSVRQFQVAVQTLSKPAWHKIRVPGAVIGEANYDFAMSHQGGTLVEIDGQLNTTSWGADNIHDGDTNTTWLSSKENNNLAFQFDADEDGLLSTSTDWFTLDSFYLRNYGNDDRSIQLFQVAVKTAANSNWQKLKVPGASVGEANYNFALSHNGGTLTNIDSQLNTTSWAAANIHDGSANSTWLSGKSNNTLEFQFDADEDSVLSTASDAFTLQSFYLQNHGNDDRSINEFQVAVKTLSNPSWQKLAVPGSLIGEPNYNFALSQHGGTLVAVDGQLNSTSWGAKNLHDGDRNSQWLSGKSNNTIDFQFDIDEDGSRGGIGDRFKLENFYLRNFGTDDRSVKHFQVEVKTAGNANWTRIPVSGTAANEPNFNFSLSANGGSFSLIDSQLNTTSYAAKNIQDGDQNSYWASGKINNTLAFTFDTDSDGTSGDKINLDKVSLINLGNYNISLRTFEIDIQVSNGAWQTINAPSGGTIFTANPDDSVQTWAVGTFNNVTAARMRTLTNYGHANYIGAIELTFSGASVGPSYTFTAAMHKNGETFNIDPAAQPVDVTDVRLRTISNYGDPSYTGANQFKLLGSSISKNKTFTAAMHANGETFSLDSADYPIDVTAVKLITISNHGDPSYIGAKEFKLLGNSITESNTFSAAMHSNGETFTLDADDVPVDVTDVKLITINNHGDPSYVGAKEFKLFGNSITETKTFTAEMNGDGEIYQLDMDDIPTEVTAVKLITINNYGDPSYLGLQEFEVIGESVGSAHTFVVPMTGEPYNILLDSEDHVTGVIGARLVTIQNHGDPSYMGIAEFKLLGTAVTPSYIFKAANQTAMQNYMFDPVGANILRFHSLNNHGSNSYIRAADFGLSEGICKAAQWRMDEPIWTGAANEVEDNTGGGFDARSVGYGTGSDPFTAKETPALAGDPGSCGYGEFDGIDDYIVSTNGDKLDELTQMTFSAWIKAASFSDSQGVFSQGPVGSDAVSYGAFFSSSGGNQLFVDINGADDRFASNTTFTTDTWYHLAIVFDGTQDEAQRVKLYVNGVLDGIFSESSSLVPNTNGDFYIGNFYSSSNSTKVFHGAIDEVNLKPTVLSASEIVDLMNVRRTCAVPLHHIQIEHDGSGLTCSAEPLTLKACVNQDCTEVLATDVNVTLSATGGLSAWSANPITIPGGGSAIVNLNHTTAETITLSASANVASTNSLVCIPDCDIEFFAAGYLLDLDNHQSCSTANLTIQAVKLSDTTTSCIAATSGDLSLDFEFSYANPSTGSIVPVLDGTEMAMAAASQNRTVTFDASGTAVLSFEYQDAGKISINVVDTSGNGLAPASVTAIVTPAKLIVATTDVNAECANDDASCSVFKQAGEAFDLSITAACSDNTVTPNFQMNNIPLSINTVAPTMGNAVVLGVNSVNLIDSDYGVHTQTNQTVSEVGVFSITATPPINGYFGETIAAATSESIGRFTPAYFDLEIVTSGLLNGGNPFVYSGQMSTADPTKGQISYTTEPEFSITAKSESGATTRNYTGDFNKLLETGIVRVTPTEDSVKMGADTINKLLLTANLEQPVIGEENGVTNYTFNANDDFVYTRDTNALIAPFISKISFEITSITDGDGIAAIDTDTDVTNGVLQLLPFGEEIRFGRWALRSSFGPETLPVFIPMLVEYWDGNAFEINTMDSNTPFDAVNDVSINDISLAPATTAPSGSGLFAYGQAKAKLAAPGENNQGKVEVVKDVPTWLQFDWSNLDGNFDGPYTENPSAIVTFGMYRGNDRVIQWREIYGN
jgi:hypothetical protein